ncbi:hypothetical protein [Amphritea pacifica]|uniref:Lipoprotein n=1 Tax=Amphritea pacifica TaxID=2811233 RepID=A0ABS2WA73_9GAMM|nr:hypothetical protein [Amphritea pacifica]MBN0988625.1 hypothetical protein [Amphritea pacifica]
MMRVNADNRLMLGCVLLILLLTGCAAQLAPKYDSALFKGVTQTNINIMELFAAVAEGTNSADCDKRAKTFNRIIGSVDALAIQASARPVPDSSVAEKVNAFLESKGVAAMNGGKAPSSYSLEHVSRVLTKMKQVDCGSGLKPGAVAAFKNDVVVSMDQVITYESFLER